MTKQRDPRPEPSSNTGYDSYYFPRSKTPEKQALYDFLFENNWRFDTVECRWHTPEAAQFQASGRLEYAADYSWARIQPPNRPGSMTRGEPIAEFRFSDGSWLEAEPAVHRV